MNELERRVRFIIYRSFLERGSAPAAEAMAEELGVPSPAIVSAMHRLAEAHAIVVQPGSETIWMAHPFSGIETDVVARTSAGSGSGARARTGRSWFANCVWDGLAILALVGDGSLETRSPETGAPLTFEVRSRQVRGDGLIHFLVPAARFWDDIGFT